MNFRSIRFRLAVWQGALFAAVFAVLALALSVPLRDYLNASALQSQARWARQISETLIAKVPQEGETPIGQEIKAVYAPELVNRFIRVTRADGSLLYRSGPPEDESFAPSQVPAARRPAAAGYNRVQALPDGTSLLIAAIPTLAAGRSYLVEVGISSDSIDRLIRHLLVLLALGIPLVSAVAAAGGYLLAKRALTPVEQIATKAELITHHNLSERLPLIPSGDELERLTGALNRMITRLDDAFSNSQRFVADASHELRTPLTVIQGELENLVAEGDTPPDGRERLGSMLEEVERLAKIVKQLFALSQLDAGEAQKEWVRLDLAALTAATSAQMALLAEDKQIRLSCLAERPVYVMGDRARLKQVVVNLLDNAIKYTSPHGTVQLQVSSESRSGILNVADTGSGIPAEALPWVFDRFYRVNRDRAGAEEGAGLGLAIVKSICGAHGGKVEVTSVMGAGSQFVVTLPLAPAPT